MHFIDGYYHFYGLHSIVFDHRWMGTKILNSIEVQILNLMKKILLNFLSIVVCQIFEQICLSKQCISRSKGPVKDIFFSYFSIETCLSNEYPQHMLLMSTHNA